MTSAARTRFTLLLLASLLVLASCGEPYRKPPPPTYTVKAGDTVYSIAWRHRMDYRVLARWNDLPPDYRIEIGQVLRLRAPKGSASRTPSVLTPAPPVARTPSRPPIDPSIAGWMWPAEGSSSIVRHAPTSSQGLLISGSEGAPVRAAAAGRVVYTGSGLRGFGNLLIIKHSSLFLSAYGHNRSVSVKEG